MWLMVWASGLAKPILQGTVKGGRRQGRSRQVPEGRGEQRKMEETGFEVICGAPTILWKKMEFS